jgi:hypothetical protein
MIFGSSLVIFLFGVTFIPVPNILYIGNTIGSKEILIKVANSLFRPFIDAFNQIKNGLPGGVKTTSLPLPGEVTNMSNMSNMPNTPSLGDATKLF